MSRFWALQSIVFGRVVNSGGVIVQSIVGSKTVNYLWQDGAVPLNRGGQASTQAEASQILRTT